MKERIVVVIDVVGLRPEHLAMGDAAPNLHRLATAGRVARIKPVFPAVTLPVQASLTTGLDPQEHGVVANGFYSREDFTVGFWEQAASLVQGERFWEKIKKRRPEFKTAVLFWQNSLYARAEVVITPRPLHTDDGMISWCYSKPVGLY
ncbi:MAG: alkaline phosphatase family protein, partial [Deltaproteobacteria bacterium]|nr:alkaline phosphatase family protein [Deltaproteobacteria bacterium]